MELKDYFLVLGPLVGVLIGGAITTVVKVIELSASKKRELEKIRIDRIEALYFATNEIFWKSSRLQHYLSDCPDAFDSAECRIKFDAYIDSISQLIGRAHAIHNLYVAESGEMWDDFGDAVRDFIQTASDVRHGNAPLSSIGGALDNLLHKLTQYHIIIIEKGRGLTRLGLQQVKQLKADREEPGN